MRVACDRFLLTPRLTNLALHRFRVLSCCSTLHGAKDPSFPWTTVAAASPRMMPAALIVTVTAQMMGGTVVGIRRIRMRMRVG